MRLIPGLSLAFGQCAGFALWVLRGAFRLELHFPGALSRLGRRRKRGACAECRHSWSRGCSRDRLRLAEPEVRALRPRSSPCFSSRA